MSVLVDSVIWIALYNTKDEWHEQAVQLMKEIELGRYGELVATDYILDECVNYCLVKYSPDKSLLVGNAILETTEMIQITKEVFDRAWDFFKQDKNTPHEKFLSFTDCTNVIIAKMFGIKYIASFDSGFKKYVTTLPM